MTTTEPNKLPEVKLTGKLKNLPLTDDEKKRIAKLQSDLKEYQTRLNKRYSKGQADARKDRARAISILGACLIKSGESFWNKPESKSLSAMDIMKLVSKRDAEFLFAFLEKVLNIQLPASLKVFANAMIMDK